jgi:hypothetical protein
MIRLLQRLDIKRKTAGLMAMILTTMAFLPYIPPNMVSFADYAQIIEPAAWRSWDPNAYEPDNIKGYTPTGLMYETKWINLKDNVGYVFPAGAKQYLVENKQHSNGSFSEFDRTFLYCVQGHTENAMIYLGSQAFLDNYWTADKRPPLFPKKIGDEKREKFNFLMNVYATHMGSNDSIAACNDANAGTAKYIVASVINWLAADDCAFTGEWGHDIDAFRESDNYKAVLKQLNPNAVGDRSVYNQMANTQVAPEYAARGCKNWAEWTFGNVWDAATITSQFNVDAEETIYFAKVDHASETYTITLPYPNVVVKDYYQRLSARDLYGDWTYTGPTDAGLVFTSQSGEIPTDGKGIGTLYWSNQNQVGAVLAKDIGSAQLATFKFYTRDSRFQDGRYAFDISQTYFAAKMDKDLEVHVRIGSDATGGIEVHRYKHTEGFGANYNVGLLKYDSETGKPLAGSHWDILEAFDDSQLDHTDLDLRNPRDYSSNLGSLTGASWEEDTGSDEARISINYSGDTGLNDSEANLYNQANSTGSQFQRWSDPENDPCGADDHITDENGELHYVDSSGNIHSKIAHQDTKSYTYLKGYCTGHPAPVVEYEEIPEAEYDEETGEQTNENEIEAVEEYNQQLHDEAWAKWLAGVEECEQLVEEGGFFHAIDLSGEVQREALEEDRNQFYKDFISLKYDYSAKEIAPAPGYSLHGSHPDDIPMEWRTVTSSEYKDYRSHGLDYGRIAAFPEYSEDSHPDIDVNSLEGDPFISFGTVNRLEEISGLEVKVPLGEQPVVDEMEDSQDQGFSEESIAEETKTVEENLQESEEESMEETDQEIETETAEELETEAENIEETRPETQEEIQEDTKETAKEEVSKKKTATDSEAEKVNGGITLTGLMEKVAVGFRSLVNKVATYLRFADDEDSSSGGSISSLQESSESSRIEPLNASIKDWTFIAYDHRTEGEIHFNKKDMTLKGGEIEGYSAYGDSQGDGTLEGAIYGLFAATDIPHPDGHSGILFQKDNLVSVAATDRNGDGTFLAITQAPGYTYNYETGTIEKVSGGFADSAPKNLYTSMRKAIAKESDIERFVGHTESGSSISLTDSRSETSSGYEKLSSNQGKDGTGESGHSYPIENNEDLNGNCWIGRPLIVNADGTQYYIKELTRSEGYELSVYGKDAAISNREAFQAGGNPSVEGTVTAGSIGIDRVKKINTFTINSSGTTNGYRVYAQNIPKDASFYITRSEVVEDPNGTHTEYVTKEETAVAQEEGARVIINGSPVVAKAGDADSYMLGQTEISNRSPLIDHAQLFLSYLNLPSQYYEITSIEWDGDPVLMNGEMIRNAIAHGRKLVKDIRGAYRGNVTFPPIEASVYHGTYIDAEAENQTEQIIYKKEATATYEQDGRKGFWDYLKWLLSNPITLAILLFLLLIAVILLILAKKSMKRKKNKIPEIEEEEDEEI